MNETVKHIESQLGDLGQNSQLSKKAQSQLPPPLKEIHSYKIFGSDLLSVPAELIIEGDEEEYEKPFSFLDDNDWFNMFEQEYRPEVPKNFIPLGHLYGGSDIVVCNDIQNSIHVFHVSDIADKDWLKYKLNDSLGSFQEFIQHIRPQTVTCLLNPEDYSKAILIELRNGKAYVDYEFREPKGKDIWQVYLSACKSYMEKGMEIHYAPQIVRNQLKT